MGEEEKKQQNFENSEFGESVSSKKHQQFNAGKNDSDYDGGHPDDALTKKHKPNEKQQEHSTSNSYNSGKNDSDYDGGHPEDANRKNKGK